MDAAIGWNRDRWSTPACDGDVALIVVEDRQFHGDLPPGKSKILGNNREAQSRSGVFQQPAN
jgi:hypothetical protein